ncbi:segregation/condensation protein A, partial [Pseudomonas aeruginosa]|nr:segregation/condensation protein A [Pseudomonas aeruginosa]
MLSPQFKSKLFSCYNILENYAHMTQYEVDIMYEVKLDAFNGPLD